MKRSVPTKSRSEIAKLQKRDLRRLVGRRIRIARKNAGLFQRELAEKVGVSRNQITSVELGVSDTGFTVIVEIARAVGVKTSQLLGEQNCYEIDGVPHSLEGQIRHKHFDL
jgi:ribosome-binding protein aMBF1 (putative translation factor)